jgi:hypothetical protein
MLPQEARVSASNHLAAHLSQRETIYHFPFPRNFSDIDFIVVDLIEYFPYMWLPRQEELSTIRNLLLNEDFSLRFSEDGILVLEKGLRKENGYYLNAVKVKQALPQQYVNMPFGDRLLLLGYDLKDSLEIGRKQRIVYYWQVLKDFDKKFSYTVFGSTEELAVDYILIDTLENNGRKIRLVHLPAYLLCPPNDWKAGDIIREELDFYIPEESLPGNYSWNIGLYVVPKLFFIQPDAKNLVPGTQQIKLKNLRIGGSD